jgi:hypothetical protein
MLQAIGLNGTTVPGWVDAQSAWVYVSATSFKVVGADVTNRYPVGTKLSCTDAAATKYFYVVSSAYAASDTTVTITGGSDYTLSGGAITNPRFSYVATPQGFPGAFAYTPTEVGWAEAGLTIRGAFALAARNLTAWLYAQGTSDSTTTTLTIPFVVSAKLTAGYNTNLQTPCRISNNGGALTFGMAAPVASSATVTFYADAAASSFAAANGKLVEACITVPI